MPSPPTVRALAAVAVCLGLVAAGCADEPGGGGAGSPPPDRPTAPDEVVVQLLVDGGFVPVEAAVRTVPAVTVLGDGTVLTPAAVPAIYPGPAIVPMQQVRIGAAEVDRLVALAADLGLLEAGLDLGDPPVADAPTTTVTVVAGGTTYVHAAYALGLDARALGRDVAANRRALQQFVDALHALPPGEEPWVPDAVVVGDLGPYRAEPDLPQRPRAWPLATPPATGGEGVACTLVEAPGSAVLLDALAEANERTPWVVDGRPRSLAFRPLVPGQPGCPS